MNKLVSGAIGVSIPLTYGKTKFYLPDVIDLRKKRIKHIDFCSSDNISHDPDNTPIASLDDQLTLTIMEANTQKQLIQDLPLQNLSISGNKLFINKIVDFQRSFITLSGYCQSGDVSGKCVYLVFWYDEPAVWNHVFENNRTIIEPLEITLSGNKTFFTEQLAIKNKKIENILLSYPVYTPSGNQGIAQANFSDKFLSLSKNNLLFFNRVPLYLFYQPLLNASLRLQNITVDFEKSYVESISTNDIGHSVFFNCIIDDNK